MKMAIGIDASPRISISFTIPFQFAIVSSWSFDTWCNSLNYRCIQLISVEAMMTDVSISKIERISDHCHLQNQKRDDSDWIQRIEQTRLTNRIAYQISPVTSSWSFDTWCNRKEGSGYTTCLLLSKLLIHPLVFRDPSFTQAWWVIQLHRRVKLIFDHCHPNRSPRYRSDWNCWSNRLRSWCQGKLQLCYSTFPNLNKDPSCIFVKSKRIRSIDHVEIECKVGSSESKFTQRSQTAILLNRSSSHSVPISSSLFVTKVHL